MVMSESTATPTQQPTISPRGSAAPLISSAQREAAAAATGDEYQVDSGTEDQGTNSNRSGKRRFFGLGRKKENGATTQPQQPPLSQYTMASTNAMIAPPQSVPNTNTLSSSPPALGGVALRPLAAGQVQPVPISPSRNTYPANLGASPSRLRSASPRRHSPASSEIFERNVQEPAEILQLQGELSPAHIPSHVITEDHIPPALEASAQAITSESLNPDEVEIVMSAAHQPAASVLEATTSHADLSQVHTPLSPLHPVRSDDSELGSSLPPTAEEDGAVNYGQLDPNDVRRLSFISFADVVQSEQHAPPPPGLGDTSSSGGVTTPPLLAISEHSLPPPSGTLTASPHHSELTIETMRQAVRKTASGDLSGVRSSGMSPVSEEHLPSVPRSRTNS